jgi:glutamate racemase
LKTKGFRIGVFDSGIGGLTVLETCLRVAPDLNYFYYGDNFHAPYGNRSAEEITVFVRRALTKFSEIGVDAAVLACNTATAVCAERMRGEFPFPVIGTEPAVKVAAKTCRNVLVLATSRTVESARFQSLIQSVPSCRFTPFAARGLAGAIEAKFLFGKSLTLSDHLPKGNYDGVVLGCTHYVYLKSEISAFYGGIPVFDGNEGTAKRLVSVLSERKTNLYDHRQPLDITQNTNNCLTKIQSKGVYFVGKGGKINESVFKSERMF